MIIYVIDQKNPKPERLDYPCLILKRQSWNDFGFGTLFSITGLEGDDDVFLKSSVKILRRVAVGEHDTIKRTPILSGRDGLTELYCSVGQDLEYYRQLRRAGSMLAQDVLRSMRDAAYSAEIREEFENLPGFENSLIRYSEARNALDEGLRIIRAQKREKLLQFSFSCQIGDASKLHKVDFDFADGDAGLRRSMVLIGRNGTGKTEYLANFARGVSGRDRVGEFWPEAPKFSRVIVVSFSVFDVFQRPTAIEKRFSYRYVGLRKDPSSLIASRRKRDPLSDKLMTQRELVRRLRGHLDLIREKKSMRRWRKIVRSLLEDDLNDPSDEKLDSLEFYAGLSSGQKFATSAVTGIIANITDDSLILFDEPENHLHPDIFSLFLNAMTLLVEKFKSYAVYSTHAPLVLQQTLARQVRVFRRIGNVPSITPLKMESFGANLTSITQEVFESASAGENFTPMLKKLLVEEPEGAISDRLFKLPLPLQTATQVRLIQEGSV